MGNLRLTRHMRMTGRAERVRAGAIAKDAMRLALRRSIAERMCLT